MTAPTLYTDGYRKARAIDAALAERYIEHLWIGDPLADAVLRDVGELDDQQAAHLIRGATQLDEDVLRGAPPSLRALMDEVSRPPAWYDRTRGQRGCSAFLRNSDHILAAFVAGAIVEGFATRISKSFAMTGRMIDDGVRRLKQNIRHLTDIFLPLGVEPSGDGWKLSLRIRLIHARMRWLFHRGTGTAGEQWDREGWGEPISAAHLTLATAAFSARMIEFAEMLGADLDDNDRAGIMEIWIYSGWLMGVPEAILFHNQADGLRLLRLARACEPPPDDDAVALANCIINSAPVVVGITDPLKRERAAHYIFRVSREMIGNKLADRLAFPRRRGLPLLPWLRTRERVLQTASRVFPPWGKKKARAKFEHVLGLAHFMGETIDYDLPDHIQSDRSKRW